MKRFFPAIAAAAILLCPSAELFAEGTNQVATDINALVTKINAKLELGHASEMDLAAELKEFDAIYAKDKTAQPIEAIQILTMKAKVYLEVLNEPEEAAAAFQQIKRDVPEAAKQVDEIVESLKDAIAAEKIRRTLVAGIKLPDFAESDLAGQPLSIAHFKGKVVLVDFWATWCVPCRVELPNVLKTYNQYHAKGFEIVGVNLDEDQAALKRFIKENGFAWPQYFDGKRFDNKLAMKYGVTSIPSSYLLDGDGKIIGVNLRGAELTAAVAKALAKK